jgi:hypothetical protein
VYKLKEHSAGRDVLGEGDELLFSDRYDHGEHERKTHRATHFLP